MFVVDASVWVARYLPSDVNHRWSAAWLLRMLEERTVLLSPALLLPEVTGPLSRLGSELVARRALSEVSRLTAVRLVPLERELSVLAGRAAARLRLRGADAVYVALAEDIGVPLVTWDGEQRERGGAAIKTHSPAELMGGG